MRYLIYIIIFLPFISICGQNTMPGGVNGACVWEVAEITKNGLSQFRSVLPGTLIPGFKVVGKTKTINNNPALFFTGGTNTVNSTLDLGKLQSFSLFTVCQETDTISEKIIVSLENDSIAETVLTDRRIAALDIYRYASYNSDPGLFPKIYSYTQNKSTDSSTLSRRLQLGRPPRNQHIPASVYSGIIPEVILFKRVISPKERQQVESYLAIKYGIPLNQELPVSYLNSRGNVTWDAELNEAYNRNIAGIGRDDLSGLNQHVSVSTLTPGIMKIGLLNELKDNSYVIWGDNGGSLSFDEEPGIRKLKREWKISAFNSNSNDIALFLETDMMSLNEINPLDDGEIFWLMADRSGTGKYPFRQTDYFQCRPLSSTGSIIRFSPVVIDADHSGNDVFTIIAAPAFFARSILLSPTCRSALSGIIETEICGGEPPFDFVLKGVSDSRFHVSYRGSEREHIFEDIRQGAYFLTVTDSENHTYSEKLWVSNTASWKTQMGRQYTFREGEGLVLDASEGMPELNFIYSWTTPEGSLFNSSVMTISQPGVYLLSVTDEDNCNSTQEISVRQTGESVFRITDLYPNPVNGWFTVRIMLDRETDVNVIITDATGRILKQILMQNDRFYRYKDMIRQPGIYFITLMSEGEKQTLRLIVQ